MHEPIRTLRTDTGTRGDITVILVAMLIVHTTEVYILGVRTVIQDIKVMEGPSQYDPPRLARTAAASMDLCWCLRFLFLLFCQFTAQLNAFMCPPLFKWLVGKSELADGVVDVKVCVAGVRRVARTLLCVFCVAESIPEYYSVFGVWWRAGKM